MICIICCIFILIYQNKRNRNLIERLQEMMEAAKEGRFTECHFDESLCSSLESEMAEYLDSSERLIRQAAEEKGGEVLSDCTDGCREPLSQAAEEKDSELQTTGNPDEIRAVIIGESVFCTSLAAAIELDTGIPVRVLCPLEEEDCLLRPGDRKTPEEDDLSREIGGIRCTVP